MSNNFSYKLLAGWLDIRLDAAKELLIRLRPHQRLLLTSEGSLTLDIEQLLETEIKVELVNRNHSLIDSDTVAFLDSAAGAQVCERVVWLTAEKRRLVYAHTVFELERTDPAILEFLDRCLDEPLGKVLNHRHIYFTKSRMEAGVVNCPQAASTLKLAPDTRFIARRYVLNDTGLSTGNANRIKAAVVEVFSPDIIPADTIRLLE